MDELPTVASLVIRRFGGLTKLARALGQKHPTTVAEWKRTGRIPPKHWPAVERAAFEAGFLEFTVRWLGEAHANQEKARAVYADAKKKIEPAIAGAPP